MTSREDYIHLAKLAGKVKRYEDMLGNMHSVAETGVVLTKEERNLLSFALQKEIEARRSAWKVLNHIKLRPDVPEEELTDYCKEIGYELMKLLAEILNLLDTHLIPSVKDMKKQKAYESTVLYYKMKGECHGYLAEIASLPESNKSIQASKEAFWKASDLASEKLKTTNPVTLDVAVSFSQFYHDVMGLTDEACAVAKAAFCAAIAELGFVKEENYEEVSRKLQILRDNLKLWTPDD